MMQKIIDYINNRYPNDNPRSIAIRDELCRVCCDFIERELNDQNFVNELTSGSDSKFWERISEAFLADLLREKLFTDRPTVGEGPDFLVKNGNLKIWIEVICPEPKGIPDYWRSSEDGVFDYPHNNILLRWTAAIKEKAEKLMGDEEGQLGYLRKGIVTSDEAFVIAVNACQLRKGKYSAMFGISQFPYAVEAVFPIGPKQLRLNKEIGQLVERGHKHRPHIINKNNSPVPTFSFLDPHFNSISAIWGVDIIGESVIGNVEPMFVVHNPLAINPIPTGFLPSQNEYVATPLGNGKYIFEDIEKKI